MESTQTMNAIKPEDDDLAQATVRELIIQLAQAEDDHRSAADPARMEAVARREQAIVAALHRNGLPLNGPRIPKVSVASTGNGMVAT